jgi:hypothetical protein
MVVLTLAVAAAVAFVVASAYGFVGRRLLLRKADSIASQRALRMFAGWWLALAVNIVAAGVLYMAAAVGWTSFETQLAYAVLQRLLLAVSLMGLMHYLIYVVTGRTVWAPLILFYGGYWSFLLYTMAASQPVGIDVGAWRTDLQYAAEGRRWWQLASFLWLVVPPVVGALAYFRLFFRVHDATRRWRIALVAWAVIVWWVVAVVAGQRQALGDETFQFANRFLGLGAALAVLMAYQPPSWVRRRWGVQPLVSA